LLSDTHHGFLSNVLLILLRPAIGVFVEKQKIHPMKKLQRM
jgi:hypothetical protein